MLTAAVAVVSAHAGICGITRARRAAVLSGRASAGSKFVDGERHAAECITGGTGVVACTFLIGNAEFYGVHEILLGTLDADDREESERYRKVTASFVVKIAEHTSYHARNVIAGAAATAALCGRFNNACAEDYGIDRFHHCNGKVVAAFATGGSAAEAVAHSI